MQICDIDRGWISIHALVKRATIYEMFYKWDKMISIHALVKRATNIIIFVHNLGFISIHALVKRATLYPVGLGCGCLFQSTPS